MSDAPTVPEACAVGVVAHAPAMGTHAKRADDSGQLGEAFRAAKARGKTSVIVMNVDVGKGVTTEGHTWWEIGTPLVSDKPEPREKRPEDEFARVKRRRGV